MASGVERLEGGAQLKLLWKEGGGSVYPAVWLRDNCRCSSCYTAAPIYVRTLLMEHLDVECTVLNAQLSEDGGQVTVVWSDGHSGTFCVSWLRPRAFEPAVQRAYLAHCDQQKEPWGAELADRLPRLSYSQVMQDDAALLQALTWLEQYGLVLLQQTPTETGHSRKLCERIAFMRKTHFGEEFTVRVKVDPNSIAYTGRNIEIHTDACYYDYLPGIQLLHFIVQYEGRGGETQLTDGLQVCKDLRQQDPEAFNILRTVEVNFRNITLHDEDGKHHFKTLKAPVITTDSEGNLQCLRFTTSQRDSHFTVPLEHVQPWYRAAKKLLNLFYHPKYIIKRKMHAGDMIVFDNIRVVHGREPLIETDKVGERHLEGGYLDWDEVRSRRRVLFEKLNNNPSGYQLH